MSVLIGVSATEEEAARLGSAGPRRDFVELAQLTAGRLVYRKHRPRKKGILGRLIGPHGEDRSGQDIAHRGLQGEALRNDPRAQVVVGQNPERPVVEPDQQRAGPAFGHVACRFLQRDSGITDQRLLGGGLGKGLDCAQGHSSRRQGANSARDKIGVQNDSGFRRQVNRLSRERRLRVRSLCAQR